MHEQDIDRLSAPAGRRRIGALLVVVVVVLVSVFVVSTMSFEDSITTAITGASAASAAH